MKIFKVLMFTVHLIWLLISILLTYSCAYYVQLSFWNTALIQNKNRIS